VARFIGNYEVIRELGSGHFGTVYLAAGEVPGRGGQAGRRRLVAIKKLKDTADAESMALLVQEFALLDQVKHRGVVRVFEYLADENAVVMEHIHGVTLRRVQEELAKAREQVFTEAGIEIGCEIADALFQAYTTPGDNGEPLQLVHRDLKPANIMLTPQGEVKILDWGLARVDNADFRKEARNRVKGTLLYMAPEQARAQAIDHRTDLFALGLMLYELLLNKTAYPIPDRAPDPVAAVLPLIEAGNLSAQCRELEKVLPGVGPVITRALQARPADRYRSGQEMMVDLRRQLYRDRGAYLQEFCEFFFGTICDLGDVPTLESLGVSAKAPARRTSIGDRLKESMVRDAKATPAPVAVAPKKVEAVAPKKPDSAPTPGLFGAPMSAGPRRPSAPPVGGAASRAPVAAPPPAGGGRPKAVGQRSPDETGMLPLQSLRDSDDEVEASGDPSATAFFAIPAPKAGRSSPTSTAPPPPPVASPGGFGAPPPMPGIRPPMPPAPGPMGVGGGPPPPPPMGIQGPVAGYGGSGGGSTPFQVPSGAGVAPPASAEARVQSNRVYAILFAVFMLVCAAVFVAVWVSFHFMNQKETVAEKVVASNDVKAPPKELKDTGIKEPVVEATKTPKTPKTPKPASSDTTPKPAPAPKANGGTVTVRIEAGQPYSAVEVVCPSTRLRGSFSGGVASIPGVPGEDCSIMFKGGPPAQYKPVRGGQSVSCTFVGTTASCR